MFQSVSWKQSCSAEGVFQAVFRLVWLKSPAMMKKPSGLFVCCSLMVLYSLLSVCTRENVHGDNNNVRELLWQIERSTLHNDKLHLLA